MAARDGKRAENQDMSRSANERLQDVAGRTAEDGIVIPFLCECAADDCFGRVDISIDEYFIAHLAPEHYVILPGHPRIDGEVVVEDRGHYELVAKAAAWPDHVTHSL
jgi:hypothetical protein